MGCWGASEEAHVGCPMCRTQIIQMSPDRLGVPIGFSWRYNLHTKNTQISTYSLMRDKCIHSCHRDPNQECSFIPEISLVLLVQTATAMTSVAVIGFAALEFYMRAIARFLVPAGLGHCCTDQPLVPFSCSVCCGDMSPSVGGFHAWLF